ncbi:tRNA (cytosine(34)-C(5))-methyltransferase (NOP2/Sun domain family member 2 ortholog) [Durusdinium trenchii]|uniref:tRNA (Cytosine(34)-C(5))-methyltransferase (NOP2/Sun domain family member 2 ortholog) n=1 Tax=Durusdinium trenchii TaxID=1381693 RepID=A0ABP0N0C7_9DINO
MGDATNETFEVTLQRQGPYPAQRHGFSCQATHEAVLARAIQLHEEHLAQREVDPSSVVLRFRDQDGQLLTIHDDLNLVRAMEEARDSQGLVQLDFLLQVAPQARQQRQCRSCQQLFTSRNQLFLHLKASGHDEDLPSDEEPHESAGAGSLKNDAFCDYYRQQRIVPEELWPLAYEALKTPLPLVLRATGHALATGKSLLQLGSSGAGPIAALQSRLDVALSLRSQGEKLHRCRASLGCVASTGDLLPVLALEVKPDETVLDLCASPGSKTLQLLEYQSGASVDGGLLVANELSRSRALVVAQRSRRADRRSLLVTNLDGRQFPALKTPQGRKRKFQKVLVDAPCSGDGTLRKSCGGWATWRAAEGNSLHPLQRGLLRRGFELLEPGGRLVYSTCSLNPIENEAVVAAFLSETSNAELLSWDPLKVESFQEGVTEWMVPESDFETSRLMHKSYDAPQRLSKVTRPRSFPRRTSFSKRAFAAAAGWCHLARRPITVASSWPWSPRARAPKARTLQRHRNGSLWRWRQIWSKR